MKASEERRHEYMVGMIHDMEVRAEGVEQGIEQGIEQNRIASIKNVMDSLAVEASRAMDILQIPEQDRQRYLAMLL